VGYQFFWPALDMELISGLSWRTLCRKWLLLQQAVSLFRCPWFRPKQVIPSISLGKLWSKLIRLAARPMS
jgi:hypothetical protein